METGDRIKSAAKLIFKKKGLLATTVRDIATEADTNVAAVNYYFRSKDNLFRLIMAETLEEVFSEIEPVLYDATLSFIEKLQWLSDYFIGRVLKEPDLPFFLVHEVMSGSNQLPMIRNLPALMHSSFAEQLRAFKIPYHPLHLILNMGSMTLFPFLSLQQVKNSGHISEEEFIQLMEERKKLIPFWVGQMLSTL